MGYIYDDWKKLLETFQQCVEKDLDEIHKQKAEVQQIKTDIFNRLDNGLFYRNGNRIVLSAPEIVIGNVDKSGDLQGSTGRVIIKGSDIGIEGVGETGCIVSRAPSIRQIAVNPGIDGVEDVVCSTSEIISQAGSIVLHGSNAEKAFSETAGAAKKGGVWIHADQDLNIEAALPNDRRKENIENRVKALTDEATQLKTQIDGQKKSIDKFFKEMSNLLDLEAKYNVSTNFTQRINIATIEDIHNQMESLMPALYGSTIDFMRAVSKLAEVNRKKKALDEEKKKLKSTDDFKKNPTGAQMSLTAESINVATRDGDGNIHTNMGAGVNILAPRVGVSSADDKGMLVKGGGFAVNAENISLTSFAPSDDKKEYAVAGKVNIHAKDINMEAIDYQVDDKGWKEKELTKDSKLSMTFKTVEVATTNPKAIERDDKGKITKGEYTAEGDVIFKSKNFTVESLDYEIADGKPKMKALTKDGKIAIRAEKTDVLAADVEGKATGSINLNAKAISAKSMDVDKEKLTDSALAAGSTMTLVSEKMFVGSKSKDIKSKKLQAVSEEMGLFADKTFEAQQGDGKSALQLADGKAAVGGDETQVYGTTTINNDTEVKGEVKAPKISGDSIEAKSAFKSKSITDGSAAGGGGGGGSLSAKLKSEDAPAE